MNFTKLRGVRQVLAEWTGLEPATPGVTGRYSNQLNYHSIAARYKLPLDFGRLWTADVVFIFQVRGGC